MKSIERQMKDYIESHLVESRKSAAQTSLAIQNSPLEYKVPDGSSSIPIYTRTLHIPKFFTQKDRKNFEDISRTFYTIFKKAIQAYDQDPKVRELFGFEPELEKLILKKPKYSAAVPILRVDIFYDEENGGFQVCEFNTDGTSAMYENNRMYDFLKYNNAWNALKPDAEYLELMDTWADALLLDIKEASGCDQPSVAITDFLENAYLPELFAFERLLQKRGLKARVIDIRKLGYDGTSLYDPRDGLRFDAVYRRAVTSDVMHNYKDIAPFIQAVLEDKTVLVGAFQTQIPHSKRISMALFDPVLAQYFTDEENAFIKEHLPAAFRLDKNAAQKIIQDKDSWIIKPEDSYGARGVYAGVDLSDKLWKKLVNDRIDSGFIVQKYISHYKTINIDLLGTEGFKDYSNMTGLYLFNGQFSGVYSRLSDMGIISTQYNERMVPTLFLKEEKNSDV